MGDNHILLTFLFLLVLLSSSVSAEMISMEEAEELAEKVKDFTEGQDIVVIMGTHASKTEKLAFEMARDRFPLVADCEIIQDTDLSEDLSELEGKTAFLIGGPKQNMITSMAIMDSAELEDERITIGRLSFATTADGKKFVIASDSAGYENAVKTGPQRSPLAKFMPVKYVPAAATGIGILLLWLWKFIFKILNKIARLFLSSKIMSRIKKKELKREYKGFKMSGVRFKIREWFSIFLAALVFALAVAYTYLNDMDTFLVFTLSTTFVNMLIYAIRHFTRLFMDKVIDLHTEYVFWHWGAIITVLTGWLGNTFSLAGYQISDRTTKREGKIAYAINFFTFLASLIFLIWNFLSPSEFMQMAMVLSMSIAVIQMLPIDPFAGKKILYWRKLRWYLTFIPMAIVYILVNIII